MTNREAIDLLQAAVDDAIADLARDERDDETWAKTRIIELEEAMEKARKALERS